MFTGIIQNTALVTEKKEAARSTRFTFKFARPEKNIETGESIAVNGVCLTVVKGGSRFFSADVVGETLKATTLGSLEKGRKVNIERALRAGQAIGGHFVTGHVDGRGRVDRVEDRKKDRLYYIEVPEGTASYMARKGSVTVDGVSLTIQDCLQGMVLITVIPHTLQATTLGTLKAGNEVNIEADMIARYLDGMLSLPEGGPELRLRLKDLLRQGF